MEKKLSHGSASQGVTRSPGWILYLFVLIATLSTTIAFLGYRYLELASEYRARNLLHLDSVYAAKSVLHQFQMRQPIVFDDLRNKVETAQEQATWCFENLRTFEKVALHRLGEGGALDICYRDVDTANALKGILDRLAEIDRTGDGGNRGALLVEANALLSSMLADSQAFGTHVDSLERKIALGVRTGTAVVSLALCALMLFLLRILLRSWRDQADKNLELARVKQRLELAMRASSDGFALFDEDRTLLFCNRPYQELSHPDPDFVQPGKKLDDILSDSIRQGFYEGYGPTEQDRFISNYIVAGKSGDGMEVMHELSGDRHVMVRHHRTDLNDSVVIRVDRTATVRTQRAERQHAQDMREAKERIEKIARTDSLTGLANRSGLEEQIRLRMVHGPVALIRIDLDRFKQVNDVFGHAAGDFVLKHVAHILRAYTRDGDLVARVGGDEFVILCALQTSEKQAMDLSARILDEVLKPIHYEGKQCLFGASFGVALSAAEEREPSVLLNAADSALYRAKELGRSTVELFTPDLQRAVARERAIAETIVPGLAAGHLKAFGQSLHHASDWSLAGVEILARWQHPDFGLLRPDEFLHIAKQMGMEADIDAAVFRAALSDLEPLRNDGFDPPRLSFNVSAGRLVDPAFRKAVEEQLPHPRDRFAFEILESIWLDDLDSEMGKAVDALKSLGVQIDVDDFGSGHASINSVMRIGPDTVKIDREIVQPLGFDARNEKMIEAIVEMGRAMEVTIVAEGVETEAQARTLCDLGVQKLQGYFFSRPMPLRDLARHCASLAPIDPQRRSGVA